MDSRLLAFVEWGEYLQIETKKKWCNQKEFEQKINLEEIKKYFNILKNQNQLILKPKGFHEGDIFIYFEGNNLIIDSKKYWSSIANEYQEYKDYQNRVRC